MRSTAGVVTRRRHKKLLKQVKGFRHGRKNLFKRSNEALMSAYSHAFTDRKKKKSDFRSLWIIRINAAVRAIDPEYSYSRFMHDLKEVKVGLDRKMLADLAVRDSKEFARLVELAKSAK
jgi:large subunit ribosomal protein L20